MKLILTILVIVGLIVIHAQELDDINLIKPPDTSIAIDIAETYKAGYIRLLWTLNNPKHSKKKLTNRQR